MTADQTDRTPSTRLDASSTRSRGMRQFTVGMVMYAVIVVVEGIVVEPEEISTWAAIALAAAPMASAIWAMAGWLSTVRTFDELRQKIFTESALIALGITAVATFTYGFLESLAGLPKLSMFYVFPFMAFVYSLSLPVVIRRYR